MGQFGKDGAKRLGMSKKKKGKGGGIRERRNNSVAPSKTVTIIAEDCMRIYGSFLKGERRILI